MTNFISQEADIFNDWELLWIIEKVKTIIKNKLSALFEK